MNAFNLEISKDGITLRLTQSKRNFLSTDETSLNVSDWSSFGDQDLLRGLAAVGPILQGLESQDIDHVLLTHDHVAALSDKDAKALGLPISIPYQLRVWGSGSWVDDSYDLNAEFLDSGQQVFIDNRIGSIVEIGRIRYRLPNPLFSIISEVAEIRSSDPRDKKIEAQARIAQILGANQVGTARLDPDEQVASIKIRHVAGFSASVAGSLEDPQLTPVLFSRSLVDSQSESGDILDENQQILNSKQAISFNEQFFKTKSTVSTYVLGSGEYVYIDPSVRLTFSAFHEISTADAATRKTFLKSPRAVLAACLPEGLGDADIQVETAFIETSQFSDRVIGINKWEAPVLPWLATESNEWGTNTLIFGQPGNSAPVVIAKENLAGAINAIEEGLQAGKNKVSIGGVEIPVSNSLLSSMKEFMPIDPDAADPNFEPDLLPAEVPEGPFVVATIDGFEAINYVKALKPPENNIFFQAPRALVPSTTLMIHQEDGLRWLISAYNAGHPGVLVADDMGLGKTLQALVFLALYREQVPKLQQKPCLIVAPTGLLNNWQKEISDHLGENGLGELTLAYGTQLKNLKTGLSGRDTDFGVSMLNVVKLKSVGVILTTYESLRDYQISFSQVSFGIVVFDEIQKLKNPRSLISRAAAAINGSFQVGLSGTPVENSLADLWTIMDILAPGLMKFSLKEFMKEYGGSTEDPKVLQKLKKLQIELLESSAERIAPILRRMKSEVFKNGGLPPKVIHPAESTCMIMPPEQESAYRLEVERVQKGEIKMVQGLQRFKRISMSPKSYDNWLDDPKNFIDCSARLSQFFKILDKVKNQNEKALVFVESLELQPILAQVLKERYQLKKLPLIINGKVSGKERQRSVDEFQEEEQGFNVMLISPKAGGVGLTLTAANNVIHLERWWNPAVEDQCNDRVYRIGQKKDVNIFTPVSKHPLDDIPSFDLILDGILARKRALAESIFMPSELSPHDFANYFKGSSESTKNGVFNPINLKESYSFGTGEEFENYVGADLHRSGYKVSRTKKSWDCGCDLIVSKGGQVVLCQVKQVMSDKTLADGVEEVIESRERYRSHNPSALALITNAKRITKSQMELAKRNGVLLIFGHSIFNYGDALNLQLSNGD
jgi:superfamily II DNA or RNA helicase/Holliday junction resolvase-like predicted endonuclease